MFARERHAEHGVRREARSKMGVERIASLGRDAVSAEGRSDLLKHPLI